MITKTHRIIIVRNTFSPAKYGVLYNWWAANDARIAASGWEVMRRADGWAIMRAVDTDGTFNGNTAGNELKQAGTLTWTTANGTDDYGFSARGAGQRSNTSGTYSALGSSVNYWSPDEYGTDPTQGLVAGYLTDTNDVFNVSNNGTGTTYPKKKGLGLSIKVRKTTTALSDGQFGIYVGNDGKRYKTICLGGVEIICGNLAETKWNDGSAISEVTVGATWAGLSSAAMCAYSNNWANV